MFERLKKLFSSAPPADVPDEPPPLAPFDFVVVHGSKAAETLAEQSGRPGIVPILMGDRDSFERTVELISLNDSDFASIVKAGLDLDVEEWFKTTVEAEPDGFKFDESRSGHPQYIEALSAANDPATGKLNPRVYIGLIPVEASWQVPAFLKPGGWNACPEPHIHLALFRRWHEKYGAEVTTVAHDTIELKVSRPPKNEAEALALAREHYIYCADIVDQGFETLGNLAALLENRTNWYFWWD